MKSLQARENIIENLDKLPIEILKELNNFMEFLIFKNDLKDKDISNEEIKEALKEIINRDII